MKRPFRGLRRPPEETYDVVVIGSGVGGLVTANLLARDGCRVLLVEQHYMVGGYCSTFRRAGYTFDAATHFYPLLGNEETLTGRLLVDLGVRTKWIKMDPVDTFHLPDGSRFHVPADFETYRQRLDEEFPAEREALDAFFAEVRRAYYLGLLGYFRGRETPRFQKLAKLTVREALDRFFDDDRLKLVLTADCPHWGSPPERTSFVFDSMLRLSYFLGNYYPVGGSQAFADDLGRCFEERGGHLLINTQVDRIQVEGGRTVGVEMETLRGPLKGRRQVSAPVVVSNADLYLTYGKLLGHTEGGKRAFEALEGRRASFPCFLSHIGLEGVEPEVLEEAQGYYWRHWNPDRVGRDGLICKIFVPTVYEPRMAPPGGQVVILQKVLEMDYDGVESWPQNKVDLEALCNAQLERAIPGVLKQRVVQLSASAHTSWRFTLNHHGAMLGWEMSPEQLGSLRPDIEGPFEGLYLTGHWTRPGGGITPVIVSALEVARQITGDSSLTVNRLATPAVEAMA